MRLDHSKPRVLIADDNVRVRNGIVNMLEDHCEICGQAEDGAEAVRLALQLAPDVIFLDVNMPIMNGREAAKAIRVVLPQAGIVLISVDDSSRAMDVVKDTGADGFISKNCSSTVFQQTLDAMLRKAAA